LEGVGDEGLARLLDQFFLKPPDRFFRRQRFMGILDRCDQLAIRYAFDIKNQVCNAIHGERRKGKWRRQLA